MAPFLKIREIKYCRVVIKGIGVSNAMLYFFHVCELFTCTVTKWLWSLLKSKKTLIPQKLGNKTIRAQSYTTTARGLGKKWREDGWIQMRRGDEVLTRWCVPPVVQRLARVLGKMSFSCGVRYQPWKQTKSSEELKVCHLCLKVHRGRHILLSLFFACVLKGKVSRGLFRYGPPLLWRVSGSPLLNVRQGAPVWSEPLDLPVFLAEDGDLVLEQNRVQSHLGVDQWHAAKPAGELVHAGLALGKVVRVRPARGSRWLKGTDALR